MEEHWGREIQYINTKLLRFIYSKIFENIGFLALFYTFFFFGIL